MQYHSTRGESPAASFSQALLAGLAPDGGLYIPAGWPRFEPADFPPGATLAQVARQLIAPFAAGDILAPAMAEITADACNFPAPLVAVDGAGYSVLELFHGPTAAFKDFGARFLAASLTRLRATAAKPLEILVATSGDTGGAVAAAFHRRPGIRVAVLYPRGLVSPAQEQQLTCWGDNVRSFAVRGSFDDCQRLVKAAFMDPALRATRDLSSANSINLGRLLPQAVYYAATSLANFRRTGEPLSFIVPSGNLGHVVACCWARKLGMPIGEVILAHNANRTVPDFFESGDWRPRPSVATLASAMDVGNPSNMERLRALYPDLESMRGALSACSIDDSTLRARIVSDYREHGVVWCPHTAIAAEAWARLPEAKRRGGRWCIVATAHPAKFSEIVEPLIGRKVEVPPSLRELYDRPSAFTEIDSTLPALRGALAS